ncbi:16S rRNA (guanine(527)-N(7))-methyltransferase RsmG [Parvularcula dongshanensis]|uniref:Ribosomal RNA small subunit methyltransferase G n=1 Tax=Parvularcula dongshanensis TaxID=1173995 RepID=A0A840I1F7_9PROT|nr:16S rRNA (guanine(527)-N(7))-methyltransferase RsmG [Parvularcula dongshanensis]MBB4658028.1 16S rRNA (guanine527-N7)-methyltransferase [Parvularcula dongshanensis]
MIADHVSGQPFPDLSDQERSLLSRFDELLVETTAHTNLIANSTIADRFSRHYSDSLQLLPLIPDDARTLLDIGSGGGLPGIPLAIVASARRPDLQLTLCESIGKKANFLRTAIGELGLTNVSVENRRAESIERRFDVVSARAVASLTKLLPIVRRRLTKGGLAILPKGQRAELELEEAKKEWRMNVERVTSHTDPNATIFLIRNLELCR